MQTEIRWNDFVARKVTAVSMFEAETLCLPPPLTEKILEVALSELPEGTRRATETCLQCWRERKFTSQDFISFVSSISGQSKTLLRVFAPTQRTPATSAALLRATPSSQRKQPMALDLSRMDFAAVVDCKAEETQDMSAKLVQRRRQEAKRRQLGTYSGPYTMRRNNYLSDVVRKLAGQLPAHGRLSLVHSIRAYLAHLSSPEAFVEELHQLVDDFGTVVTLNYAPEFSVRQAPRSGRPTRGVQPEPPAAGLGKRSGGSAATSHYGLSAPPCAMVWPDAGSISKRSRPAGATVTTPRSISSTASSSRCGGFSDGGASCSLSDASSPSDWSPSSCSSAAQALAHNSGDASSQQLREAYACLGVRMPDDDAGSAVRHRDADSFDLAAAAVSDDHHVDSGCGGGGSWVDALSPLPADAAVAESSPLSSSVLRETPLGAFLTARAQAANPRRRVMVKVVSETEHPAHDGHSRFTCKAIFAFQEAETAGEVVLFGMYVHEFGAAAGPDAGRVLVECIDSIPLMDTETGEERQRLLSAIIHGYFDAVRRAGHRYLHLRIPPAADEAGHIFNPRAAAVRTEATSRMAHWYRKLLDAAQRAGLVARFRAAARLSAAASDGIFPLSILPPSCVELERMEELVEVGLGSVSPRPASAAAARARFFAADLYADGAFVPPLRPGGSGGADGAPHRPAAGAAGAASVAASRRDFVALCRREHLAFNSLSAAKFSAMYLLSRMVMDELDSRRAFATATASGHHRHPTTNNSPEVDGFPDLRGCEAPERLREEVDVHREVEGDNDGGHNSPMGNLGLCGLDEEDDHRRDGDVRRRGGDGRDSPAWHGQVREVEERDDVAAALVVGSGHHDDDAATQGVAAAARRVYIKEEESGNGEGSAVALSAVARGDDDDAALAALLLPAHGNSSLMGGDAHAAHDHHSGGAGHVRAPGDAELFADSLFSACE